MANSAPDTARNTHIFSAEEPAAIGDRRRREGHSTPALTTWIERKPRASRIVILCTRRQAARRSVPVRAPGLTLQDLNGPQSLAEA